MKSTYSIQHEIPEARSVGVSVQGRPSHTGAQHPSTLRSSCSVPPGLSSGLLDTPLERAAVPQDPSNLNGNTCKSMTHFPIDIYIL